MTDPLGPLIESVILYAYLNTSSIEYITSIESVEKIKQLNRFGENPSSSSKPETRQIKTSSKNGKKVNK